MTVLDAGCSEALIHLLSLPETTDPLIWLRTQRPSLVARLSLWSAFLALSSLFMGIHNAQSMVDQGDGEGDLKKDAFLILEIVGRLDCTLPPAIDDLLVAYERLRDEIQPGTWTNTSTSANAIPLRFAIDLLQDSASKDPIRFVLDSEEAVILAVDCLLSMALPRLVSELQAGTLTRIVKPLHYKRWGPLKIKVSEARVCTKGTILTIRADISTRAVPKPRNGRLVSLGWSGFDYAEDSARNRYLLEVLHSESSSGLWKWTHLVTQLCYPEPSNPNLALVALRPTVEVCVLPVARGKMLDIGIRPQSIEMPPLERFEYAVQL